MAIMNKADELALRQDIDQVDGCMEDCEPEDVHAWENLKRILITEIEQNESLPLDPAGNPKLPSTPLEQFMLNTINGIKAWMDGDRSVPFPEQLREAVDASIMTYEMRRRS